MKPTTKKKAKYWIKLFLASMVGVVAANLIVYGMPFFGMPQENEVVSAVVAVNGVSREIEQEELQLAVALARGLRHSGRLRQEKIPSAIITYKMTSGETVEIGADEEVILYKGVCYKPKGAGGGFFRKVATSICDEWH